MNFIPFSENIKKEFNKDEKKAFDAIDSFEQLHLASMGHNDVEGYQIFTPDFIVRDMCAAIGNDVLDFSKTILEPTSGDGAFTTYILKKRLETIKDKNNFEIESLKALSTIYSIEMDKELIAKQRNNIFTLVKIYISENHIAVDESYFEMLKCIIVTNFIWGMFNSEPMSGSMAEMQGVFAAAFAMPNAEKKRIKDEWMQMPVWIIEENNIELRYEEVTLW